MEDTGRPGHILQLAVRQPVRGVDRQPDADLLSNRDGVLNMTTRKRFIAGCAFAALALALGSSSHAGDPIAVVVNTANPISSIAVSDLRPIFQTTKTSWGNSAGEAMPLNLPEDNPVRLEFDQAVLGLDKDR